jgi:hypothetical protein
MLRTCLVTLSTLFTLSLSDSSSLGAEKLDELEGTIAIINLQTTTVSIKSMDENGKELNETLQLLKDVKLLNANGDKVKLDSFKAGDEVTVIQSNDHVITMRKLLRANIMKIDFQSGTIIIKMKDKNGKEVERAFRLIEDVEYVDGTGPIDAIGMFRSGDYILFVAANGRIIGMRKADRQNNVTNSKYDLENKSKSK